VFYLQEVAEDQQLNSQREAEYSDVLEAARAPHDHLTVTGVLQAFHRQSVGEETPRRTSTDSAKEAMMHVRANSYEVASRRKGPRRVLGDCCICLASFAEKPHGASTNRLCILACKHVFHEHCIQRSYRERNRKCPLCRKEDLRGPEVIHNILVDANHEVRNITC